MISTLAQFMQALIFLWRTTKWVRFTTCVSDIFNRVLSNGSAPILIEATVEEIFEKTLLHVDIQEAPPSYFFAYLCESLPIPGPHNFPGISGITHNGLYKKLPETLCGRHKNLVCVAAILILQLQDFSPVRSIQVSN